MGQQLYWGRRFGAGAGYILVVQGLTAQERTTQGGSIPRRWKGASNQEVKQFLSVFLQTCPAGSAALP